MKTDYNIKIGDMIASDFRTAALFLGYQIDLLTERDKTIEMVCKDNNINLLHLMNDLNDILISSSGPSIDYSSWPLGLLTDLIVIRQRYVKENLPIIQQVLNSLSEIHHGHDQRLIRLCTDFSISAERLIVSLQKQVPVLCSSVKKLVLQEDEGDFFGGSSFEAARCAIKAMTDELSLHKRLFLSLVSMLNEYVPPENACSCYKITLDLLAELKNDLYKIVGLQNILYSRVMSLRSERLTVY